MRYIASDRAPFVLDAIIEDGKCIGRGRALRVLNQALQSAFDAGHESGVFITERNVADAAGLTAGFAAVKGEELIAMVRHLTAGGRVRLVVDGKEEKPARLRLATEGVTP